jgi:hypothetical protein
MVSQSKLLASLIPLFPPSSRFPVCLVQGDIYPHRIIEIFCRMDGPILHPTETQFTLPSREDLPTQQAMSPFESHLRKWDRKLNHSVATEPGAVNQLSSALEAVKEEKSEGEDAHAARSLPPSSTPSSVAPQSPEAFPVFSPPPSSSPAISSLSPPSSLSTKVGSYSSSLGSAMSLSPLSPMTSTGKVGDYSSGGGDSSASLSPQSNMPADNDPSISSVTTTVSHSGSQSATSGNGGRGSDNGNSNKTQWGTPFRVRWIIVNGLPFHSTRILRNPWNKDREVKVSRDGTELEPFVGRALLDLWEVPDSAGAHGSQ